MHVATTSTKNQAIQDSGGEGEAIDGRNLDDFGFVPRGLPVPDHHHLRGQLLLAGAGRMGLDERHWSRLLVGRSGRWDVSVDGRRRFEEDRIIRDMSSD